MIGTDPPLLVDLDHIRRCADSDAPVFVEGEIGSGTILAARLIHQCSPRAHGPFVTFHCATGSTNLAAIRPCGPEQRGDGGTADAMLDSLEAANGGTLLLHEIAELPPDVQRHLLRFVKERSIVRGGGSKAVALDVRLMTASHDALRGAIASGAFRDDLLYHLRVLTLIIPPLRAQRAEIVAIATFVLRQIELEMKSPAHEFSAAAIQALTTHDWPGNARELAACLRRAVVFATTSSLDPGDLGIAPWQERPPASERSASSGSRSAPDNRSELGHHDAARVREILLRHSFNIRRAAMDYGVSRVTMYRLIRRFEIPMTGRRHPLQWRQPA